LGGSQGLFQGFSRVLTRFSRVFTGFSQDSKKVLEGSYGVFKGRKQKV
jgi:hypothetical protein